jgi:hypothetical protein
MKLDFSSVDIAVEKVIAKHEMMFRLDMLIRKPIDGYWDIWFKCSAFFSIVHDYKQKIFALNAKKKPMPIVYEVRGIPPHNLITGKMLEDFLNANTPSNT